jgi:hypothetical protein
MLLWDTVMIALMIGSTIAFCFWARVRCAGNDGKASGFTQQQTSYSLSRGTADRGEYR